MIMKGNFRIDQVRTCSKDKEELLLMPLYKDLKYCIQFWSPTFKKEEFILEEVWEAYHKTED